MRSRKYLMSLNDIDNVCRLKLQSLSMFKGTRKITE